MVIQKPTIIACPKCGCQTDSRAKFCPGCGARFGAQQVARTPGKSWPGPVKWAVIIGVWSIFLTIGYLSNRPATGDIDDAFAIAETDFKASRVFGSEPDFRYETRQSRHLDSGQVILRESYYGGTGGGIMTATVHSDPHNQNSFNGWVVDSVGG